jgi:hypothetical protein
MKMLESQIIHMEKINFKLILKVKIKTIKTPEP